MNTPTESQLRLHETLKPSMGAALGRVHRLWRSALNQSLGQLDMTEARLAVMMHLDKLGEGCTQQAMASELAIEMPSLTRTLNQLEAKQLIERRRDAADGRVHCLWFTAAGREQVCLLEAHIAKVREQVYSGLTDQQLDAFAEVLLSMEHNVRALQQNLQEVSE